MPAGGIDTHPPRPYRRGKELLCGGSIIAVASELSDDGEIGSIRARADPVPRHPLGRRASLRGDAEQKFSGPGVDLHPLVLVVDLCGPRLRRAAHAWHA